MAVPALVRAFSRVFETGGIGDRHVSLIRMGCLYLVAFATQVGWVSYLGINYESVLRIVAIPFFGWLFTAIWAGMVLCTGFLGYIGVRMLLWGYDPNVHMTQTWSQRQKMLHVAGLMMLGFLLDAVLLVVVLQMDNIDDAVLFTAIVGGRVLQANQEAVLQYYRL